MIKQSLSDRYKVDPYGTEEIISSAANSCAPILTIDYGDEVQTDAEFTIRPTKGSLDTNISDVAAINPIKGNTISINQKITDNSGETTVGTVQFIRNSDHSLSVVGNASSLTYNTFGGFSFVAGHVYYVHLGVSILGVSLESHYGAYGIACVNKVSSISTAKQSGASHVGIFIKATVGDVDFTCYPMLINLTLIYGAGNEPSTPEAFEADYYKWFGKQLTYEPYSLGELRPVKMNGIKTTGANNSWVSVNPIPVTTLTGKLNGQGSSVVVFPDGMKKVGSIYDEIRKENSKVKAIKRIGSRTYQSGDESDSTVLTDGSTTTFYVLSTSKEYILDALDIQKIMLGANEVQRVYLGNDVIFQS